MIIYAQELRDFNKHRVQYVIVGGIAFNLLDGFRATADLDILIKMTEANLSKLVRILRRHGYRLLQPVDPMADHWETLEERVKRHARIPLKRKLIWLRQMLDLSSRHQLKLRRKLRLVVR